MRHPTGPPVGEAVAGSLSQVQGLLVLAKQTCFVAIRASPDKGCACVGWGRAVGGAALAETWQPPVHSCGAPFSHNTTPRPQSECAGASLVQSAIPLRGRASAARPETAPCHIWWVQGTGRAEDPSTPSQR